MNSHRLIFLAASLAFLSAVLSPLSAQESTWKGVAVDFDHGRLLVSENKRFLKHEDGSPFFYLGDTAWELFHRLNRENAEKYLENRRAKGFTVIQAVALAELDGMRDPNPYGQIPFFDQDLSKPNEKYWEHVDWIIDRAADKGLFIGLLPTWGDKVDLKWGDGPVVFNPENAYDYGRWIGERYKDRFNIIWIIGGDRSGGDGNEGVWNALAEGVKSVDKNHLMTFHPGGGSSSSQYFHNADWLDFNMMQTGHHVRSYAIYHQLLRKDYALEPTKPCFDGEPRYEDHPVDWNPGVLGWFDDADIRQALYWNLFSGGFGHTYGCHPVWQMKTPDKAPIGLVRNNWYDVLDLPGAWDLIHARNLIESRPFFDRRPAQELILNGYQTDKDHIVACRGRDYAFVYIPTGWEAMLDLSALGWKQARSWWLNCRTGEVLEKGVLDAKGQKAFNIPEKGGRGKDWVLVLDNAAMDFQSPGKKGCRL